MSKLLSNSVNEAIQELNKQKALYEKGTKNVTNTIIDTLADMMASAKIVDGIRWTQYTPHFNDGEACVFGINELQVRLKEEVLTDLGLINGERETYGYYGDNYNDISSIEYDIEKKANLMNNDVAHLVVQTTNELHELFEHLLGYEGALEARFGDHAQITITKDGIEVEEYEHD